MIIKITQEKTSCYFQGFTDSKKTPFKATSNKEEATNFKAEDIGVFLKEILEIGKKNKVKLKVGGEE